ncbi:hypothetical protein [Pedobacter sp.]|uniref:hypothetical protein n=1 Tax=Pedobacter sp. TaxID=1411316 RepID=UPI003C55765F
MKEQIKAYTDKSTASDKLGQRLLLIQRQLADYLNIKCENFSAKTMLALLITFCTLISAYLVRLVINAIH